MPDTPAPDEAKRRWKRENQHKKKERLSKFFAQNGMQSFQSIRMEGNCFVASLISDNATHTHNALAHLQEQKYCAEEGKLARRRRTVIYYRFQICKYIYIIIFIFV